MFFACPRAGGRYDAAIGRTRRIEPLREGAIMTRCCVPAISMLLLLGAMTIPAQEPKYPHVNLARTYEVDPKWPHKPADMPWAAMSSIAIDAKDTVYLLTRTSAPVQVY